MKIKTLHRAVARYLALGYPLEEVCSAFNLKLNTWRRIVRDSLFQQEVKRLEKEREDLELEASLTDPIIAQMKMNALRAVNRLIGEVDNFEEDLGANASTRIKAANSILDKLGYNKSIVGSGSTLLIQELSRDKLDAVEKKYRLSPQPDSFKLGD